MMFEPELSELRDHGLFRQLSIVDPGHGPFVDVQGRRVLLLCSNDYLGLASHADLRRAAASAIERYGFGSGASRLVSGTSTLHRDLEERIARFKGTESAILFNSGYAANTGIIPVVASEGDVILSDSLNHSSIIDGCRLSTAATHVYRHSDPDHLETLLKKSSYARRRLIVTDGVFSMDGDLARLPELAELAEKYQAILMVDDAHATGVMGRTGRGSAEHFNLEGRIPIQMGTLGKALGSFGAYAAGDRDLIDYLINRSRSFMYSTALPPSVCAASIAAIDIVEKQADLREKLWKNRERFVQGLLKKKIKIASSHTPIIPILTGSSENALVASSKLLEYGIYATAIRPPTVPEGTARIRATVLASHSFEHIDHAIAVFDRLQQEGYLR